MAGALAFVAFNYGPNGSDEVRLEYRTAGNGITREAVAAFRQAMQDDGIHATHVRVYMGAHCAYQGQIGGLI